MHFKVIPTVYNKMSCGPKQFLGKERFSKDLYQPFEMKTNFVRKDLIGY